VNAKVPRGEGGQVLIMVGLAAVVLFGIAGLAIDAGRLYKTKAELSRAADAAALAGVLEMDGTSQGLLDAETVAEAYFAANEPTGTANAVANGAVNELTVDASKSVNMIFMSVFGFGSSTVTARAKAGFGTVTVDAALVIDSTSSMGDPPCNSSQNNSGCPIWEAKNAAKAFKDVLLGTSPSGNVVVGVAAFRGCYRIASGGTQSATVPMPSSKANCILHDSSSSSQVIGLMSNPTTLGTRIDNINATGGSGTNLCNGISKGWEVLEGAGNHLTSPNNRRYLVVLSDGDNNYNGGYTYQTSPHDSPHTYQTHSCRPPQSCVSSGYNVGESTSSSGPCEDDSTGTSAAGEVNDADVQNGCTANNARRERQMDARTWNLAKAVEADGVEIFVVAFGVCSNTATVCGDGICTDAECDAAISPSSGTITATIDNVADQRLLKCVASSAAGTNNHYFYASSASALPTIFTTIAQQIAHRLIE
jgi:Flp pilus assembly protein TadG